MRKSINTLKHFIMIIAILILITVTTINICFRVAFRKYYEPTITRQNYNILRVKIIKTHKNVSLVTYRLTFGNTEGNFNCGFEKIDDYIFYSEPMCINFLVKDFKAYSINDAFKFGIVSMEDIQVFHEANTNYINSKYYFDPYPNVYEGPNFHFYEVKI